MMFANLARRLVLAVAVVALGLSSVACQSVRGNEGKLIGTGAGAAIGAASNSKHRGRNAGIGALVGLGVGWLVDNVRADAAEANDRADSAETELQSRVSADADSRLKAQIKGLAGSSETERWVRTPSGYWHLSKVQSSDASRIAVNAEPTDADGFPVGQSRTYDFAKSSLSLPPRN